MRSSDGCTGMQSGSKRFSGRTAEVQHLLDHTYRDVDVPMVHPDPRFPNRVRDIPLPFRIVHNRVTQYHVNPLWKPMPSCYRKALFLCGFNPISSWTSGQSVSWLTSNRVDDRYHPICTTFCTFIHASGMWTKSGKNMPYFRYLVDHHLPRDQWQNVIPVPH